MDDISDARPRANPDQGAPTAPWDSFFRDKGEFDD
jgi:hypothetical protein